VQVPQSQLRVFEPEQNFRAEGGPSNGCGYCSPAECGDYGVSEASAEFEVDVERDDVRQGLEEEVGMDGASAEMKIVGKGKGGMGR